MFLGLVGFVVGGCIWTCNPFHAELGVERCSLYSSLPGPLQTVQRAEMWDGGGGILALQSLVPVHFGVDHKKVVRHVSHILSGVSRGRSLELCTDGDLLILIADLICKRGHADDCMVRDGRVRALDKAGHDLADRAADLVRNKERNQPTKPTNHPPANQPTSQASNAKQATPSKQPAKQATPSKQRQASNAKQATPTKQHRPSNTYTD